MSDWRVIILAAGRGRDDPMAKEFGATHKCTLPLSGKPMLEWVLQALRASPIIKPFVVSIDDANAVATFKDIDCMPAANSAPASAQMCIQSLAKFPILITTGDHPLLTSDIVTHFLHDSEQLQADVTVGLATSETIQASYPETRRTYFNLGGTRVSGCNLFAVKTIKGLKLLEYWQDIERNRKKPWKLVSAFGLSPILWFAIGMLTPDRAFRIVSKKLGITVRPVFLPFAEAAIDVDKPSDHVLAEKIISKRLSPA